MLDFPQSTFFTSATSPVSSLVLLDSGKVICYPCSRVKIPTQFTILLNYIYFPWLPKTILIIKIWLEPARRAIRDDFCPSQIVGVTLVCHKSLFTGYSTSSCSVVLYAPFEDAETSVWDGAWIIRCKHP